MHNGAYAPGLRQACGGPAGSLAERFVSELGEDQVARG